MIMPQSNRKLEKSTTSVRDVQRFLSLSALLVVTVIVVYLQTTDFSFVSLDDPTYVSDNSHVKAGLSAASIAWSFTGFHDQNWIPFTWLSLMLDMDLHGIRAGGYHLTNVLLHAASSVLLLAVLAQATGNLLRSAFVAAVFALHPLHVESVAWIAERKDVLSIFFGMLSLLVYVNYAKSPRKRNLIACFLLFTCSLLAKQTLVTLPCVFLLLDYWPLRRFEFALGGAALPKPIDVVAGVGRWQHVRGLVVEKLPFFAVSVVFSVVVVLAQKSAGWNSASLPTSLPLTERLMNAVVVYALYLWKAVFPHDLAVFYPHPGTALSGWAVAAAGTLLVAISVGAVLCIRRWPFLFVGWAWYLGTLVPMIGIVQVGGQQMADRYTYFPLIGPALALAWLVPELVPAGVLRSRILPAAAVAALGALATAAFLQVGYWQNSVTLARHSLDCQPNDPFIQGMLGNAFVTHGKAEEGLALLESAARSSPRSAHAHFGLGIVLQRLGRIDEAAREYRRAIEIDDTNPEIESNLAVILAARGQYEEARQHLKRAIEIDPNYPNPYASLGALCLQQGDLSGAVQYCQQALRLEPDLVVCHQTLAMTLRAQGRNDEAQQELDKAEELKRRSSGS
jgi:protein O-mannosyl-transferase